ncbi:hypothetical protein [Streptomyces sp. NPDC048637]|uniref:hypothetical protein n=1 Tax=Streptomyces sp. NPDC048637 TaxID=3155636 RepID=UPI003445D531
MTGPDLITVNGERLWQSLNALAQIGAYEDRRTGLRGVNRLALTDADVAGRRLVISWMEQAGLTVRIDRVGKIYGRREGADPAARPVLTGSLLAAAHLIVQLRAMVVSGSYGDLRATVGHPPSSTRTSPTSSRPAPS